MASSSIASSEPHRAGAPRSAGRIMSVAIVAVALISAAAVLAYVGQPLLAGLSWSDLAAPCWYCC